MALKRLLVWAVTGPLLVWSALMLHVIYHHGFEEAPAFPLAQWPSEVKADLREAIIANRKYIIEDVKALYSSKLEPEKFFSTRATPDIAFEDPLERFEGRAELVMFMNMCKYLDGLAFKINKEVHSTHEMVYDWEISAGIKGLPAWVKFNIPMRARFLLEPADKPGSAEKIFRIIEEWGGSPLLSEASVKPSYLGLVHRNLRRFTGSMILWPAKKGFI